MRTYRRIRPTKRVSRLFESRPAAKHPHQEGAQTVLSKPILSEVNESMIIRQIKVIPLNEYVSRSL